mgnify:CR=1 FL=1
MTTPTRTVHPGVTMRYDVRSTDPDAIRRLVESTGFFSTVEVDVAVELADERLRLGDPSGYHFVFAESDGAVVGYACYGPIALTLGSFDLYWMAVDRWSQGHGVGRSLLAEVERQVQDRGGRQLYIETSSRPQYAPTRAFYERCEFDGVATLKDFYAPGDGKVVFQKVTSIPARP